MSSEFVTCNKCLPIHLTRVSLITTCPIPTNQPLSDSENLLQQSHQKMLHILSCYVPAQLLSSFVLLYATTSKPGICHLGWIQEFDKPLQRLMCMGVCIGEIIIAYDIYCYASPCSNIRLLLFSLNTHRKMYKSQMMMGLSSVQMGCESVTWLPLGCISIPSSVKAWR